MSFRYPPTLANFQVPSTSYMNFYLHDNLTAIKARVDAKTYLIARNTSTQTQSPLAFPTIVASQNIAMDTGNTRALLPPGMYLASMRVSFPTTAGTLYKVSYTIANTAPRAVSRWLPTSMSSMGSDLTLHCTAIVDNVATVNNPFTVGVQLTGARTSLQTSVSTLPTQLILVRLQAFS